MVVPPIVFALSRLAPDGSAVELGVLLVLLTPCIDYVIVFTRLAGGSDRRLLAAAPLLMLAQMALLPVYLWLFMGSELADIVEPGPFLEAFVLLIVLPLALAWATEAWAARSPAGGAVKRAVDLTPVALMALTLLVVVASQFPRVREDIDQVAGVVPLYVAFLVVMAARRACRSPGAAVRRAGGAGAGVHGRDAQLAGGVAARARARRRVRAHGGGDRDPDARRGARHGRLRACCAAAGAGRRRGGGVLELACRGEHVGGVEGAEPAATFAAVAIEQHAGRLAGMA